MVRPFNMILKDDEGLDIEYTFSSSPTDDNCFYNTLIFGKIYLEKYGYDTETGTDRVTKTLIGNIELRLYNFMQCQNDRATIDDIPYNHDDDVFLSYFFDWENEDYLDYWNDMDVVNGNILSIHTLELYPDYRCKGYGRIIIQDVFNRFYGCFGLLALEAFPLQFSACADKDSEGYKAMKYDLFKGDFRKCQQKLFNFYRSLGFERLQKTNVFYLNAAFRNEKIEGRPI